MDPPKHENNHKRIKKEIKWKFSISNLCRPQFMVLENQLILVIEVHKNHHFWLEHEDGGKNEYPM